MSASSFLSVIIIFQTHQTQGLVRVTIFSNACVAQKDMHNLLGCTPLGPEPGSDISEEKSRLKTIYCMLITMNMFCLTLRQRFILIYWSQVFVKL